jgi:hypothetical protein
VYLILSHDVWTDGLAPSWEFYVLYPTLRAEGVWTLKPNEDSTATLASYRISPSPEPGSPEHLLRLVSPQVSHYQDEAWNDRVSLLKPLPELRCDTPEAGSLSASAGSVPICWRANPPQGSPDTKG